MAALNRRSTLVAILLPLLVLAMAGFARATMITVNTLDGGSDPAPLCTLEDAIFAANVHVAINGCAPGSGIDTIVFAVSGTIAIQSTLSIGGPALSLIGPVAGGITISGGNTIPIIEVGSANLTLKNLTLADGRTGAFGFGGAIFESFGHLQIENCAFVGNTATSSSSGFGGAIFLNGGTATIVNSTFANNTALPSLIVTISQGGAIFNDVGSLTITNSTFSGNSAIQGGAVFNTGITSLRGTILANSVIGNDCFTFVGTIADNSFNIDDDGSCGFSVANHSLSSTDPMLAPLASNGGPTQTFALEISSPAIGLDTDCVDQESPTPQPVLIDQRHFIRPNSPTKCDSGAYEHDGMRAGLVVVPNTERLQIARSTAAPNSDVVNLSLSFIEEKLDSECVAGQDALNDGLVVQLYEGTCAGITSGPLFANLSPFAVHTVNHQSYGTFFESIGPESVSARMSALGIPAGTCGEWSLNLEVAGLDTAAIGLGGGNPFALVLTDASGVAVGCIDIDNAIVGNQLPTRKVRRQSRR